MNRLETLRGLAARISKSGQDINILTQIFEDYKAALSEAMSAGAAYRSGLRRLGEELPDLQRLIGKRHDAVLKGRLTDAIRTFRQQIEAAEKADMPEKAAAAQNDENPAGSDEAPDSGKRVRNMPTLGMD